MASVQSKLHGADRLCLRLRESNFWSESHLVPFALELLMVNTDRYSGDVGRGQALVTLVGVADHHPCFSHAIPLQ